MNRKLRILGLAALALALAVSGAWAANPTVDGGTATWVNAAGITGTTVTNPGVTANTDTVTLKNGAVVDATTTSGLVAKTLVFEGGTLRLQGATDALTVADASSVTEIKVTKDSTIILETTHANSLVLKKTSFDIAEGASLTIEYGENSGGSISIPAGSNDYLTLIGKGKLVLGVIVEGNPHAFEGKNGVTLEFAPAGQFKDLAASDASFDKGSIVVQEGVSVDVFPKLTNNATLTLHEGNLTINAGGVFGAKTGQKIKKLVLESGDLTLNVARALSLAEEIEIGSGATNWGTLTIGAEDAISSDIDFSKTPLDLKAGRAVVTLKNTSKMVVQGRTVLAELKGNEKASVKLEAPLYIGKSAAYEVSAPVTGNDTLHLFATAATITAKLSQTPEVPVVVFGGQAGTETTLALAKKGMTLADLTLRLNEDKNTAGTAVLDAQDDAAVTKLTIEKVRNKGDIDVAAGKTLTVGSLELKDSSLGGGDTFLKKGAPGTLVLKKGTGTTEGKVEVSQGTLRLDDPSALVAKGKVEVSNGATLDLPNGFTLPDLLLANDAVLKVDLDKANYSSDVPALTVADAEMAGRLDLSKIAATQTLLKDERIFLLKVTGTSKLKDSFKTKSELTGLLEGKNLYLKAKKDWSVPTLTPESKKVVPGTAYTLDIKVSGIKAEDVDWNSASFDVKAKAPKDAFVGGQSIKAVSADMKLVFDCYPKGTFVSADVVVTLKAKPGKGSDGSCTLQLSKDDIPLPPTPPAPGEPALNLPAAGSDPTKVEGDKAMAVAFVVTNAVSTDINLTTLKATPNNAGSWDVIPSVAFVRDVVSGDTVMAVNGTPKKGFGADTVRVEVTAKGKVLSGDIKLTEKAVTPPTPPTPPTPGPTPQPEPSPTPQPGPTSPDVPQPQPGPTPQPQPQPGPTPQPQPQPGPTPQPQPQPAPGVEVTVGANWTKTVGAADADGNVPVELRTTLTSNSTPTKVDVVLSGMTLEKVRLLNAQGGDVRLSANAEKYTLIVTGKAHKDALAAAKVVSVAVTTVDGFGGTKTVDKPVNEMPDSSHGGGSGGGGCDAGVGGLALALVGAFLLRRKA